MQILHIWCHIPGTVPGVKKKRKKVARVDTAPAFMGLRAVACSSLTPIFALLIASETGFWEMSYL